ncbi:TPA: GDP-sugar hydrolase WbdI, partial [Escherichia coli]|nr:GDP-sugar hydrolase WbdI [Escherichia coli]
MFITSDKFREIIKLVPLVSIDLLIENENGEYLFGLRNNRPAKNYFFVPGGRIR